MPTAILVVEVVRLVELLVTLGGRNVVLLAGGEQTPSRSAVQVPVNKGGGSTNHRCSRELEAKGPQKRQTMEVTSTEVPTTDADGPVNSSVRVSARVNPLMSPLHAAISSIWTALGSRSSMRQRIYEILSAPSFLSDLHSGIYSRVREWIEMKEVPLCAAVKDTFSGPPTTPGPLYRPNWDVREDESLYADIPANGGTLGYCLLKGLQLPIDCPADELVAPAAQLAHDLAVVSKFLFLLLFSVFFFLLPLIFSFAGQ